MLRHYVSLGSHDLQPMDLSVPEAHRHLRRPASRPSCAATATSPPFPRWETSLGWSFLRSSGEFIDANSAVGWNVSVAGNATPWLGIVGDVTANFKSGRTMFDETGVTLYTFVGGPRFSARTSPGPCRSRSSWWASPGPASTPAASASSTEFTIQPGGGVDLGNERVAARLSVAWRRVFYEGNPTNMFRFVGGVVIRR